MTSIPFLFPAPGANPQNPGIPGGDVAAGEGGDDIFAGLVSLEGSGSAELLDTAIPASGVPAPAANALTPEFQKQLSLLLANNALAAVNDQFDAGEDTGADATAAPSDLLAGLLQTLPQPVIARQTGTDAQQRAAQPVGAPVAPVAPAGPSVDLPAGSPAAPGPAAPGQLAGAKAFDPIDATAGNQLPTNASADGETTTATPTAEGKSPAVAGPVSAPPDGSKETAATVQQPAVPRQQSVAASAAGSAGDGEEQPVEEDKPAETLKPVPVQTGKSRLERASVRTAELALDRIATNLEHRALAAGDGRRELPVPDAGLDTPDLGTVQGALDASRGVRFAALTGSNGQAHLPIAQIAIQIAANARAGTNRFSIRLDPPELGKIDIRIEVAQDGSVASRLSVERPETLDMLLRDSKALERALNDSGLKTDANSLQFSLKGDGSKDQRGNETNGRRTRSDADQLAAIDALNDGAALGEVRRYLASSGLDIVV